MPRAALLPVLLLLLCTGPSAAQAGKLRPWKTPTLEALKRLQGERRYILSIYGRPCGTWVERFRHIAGGDGGAFVYSHERSWVYIVGGRTVRQTRTERHEFDEKAPFRLRAAELTDRLDAEVRRWRMKRRTLGWSLRIDEGSTVRTKQVFPILSYRADDPVSMSLWLSAKPKPNDVLHWNHFSIEGLREYWDRNILERKIVEAGATRYQVRNETTAKTRAARDLYDSAGRLLERRAKGLRITHVRGRLPALGPDGTGQDHFLKSMLRADKPLGDPTSITRLRLAVAGPDHARFRSGPRQRVIRGRSRTVLVIDNVLGPRELVDRRTERDYLKSTPALPSDHPLIRALARRATGGAKTRADKVSRLVRFVHRHLTYSFEGNASSVLQVVRTRRGDCSEHALLLTALCRAAGVPVRQVTGLVYMGDRYRAFGAHAWNEVALGGEWTPVDATWDETRVNATHVRLYSEDQHPVEMSDLGRLKATLLPWPKPAAAEPRRPSTGSTLLAPGD